MLQRMQKMYKFDIRELGVYEIGKIKCLENSDTQ